MKARKYSKDGKYISDIELPEIFTTGISMGAIYDAIKAENANQRTGNHSTKGRSEVRGGGIKPWAQKGTGRARQGSIRAPHWTGGGIVHGPKKRSYAVVLPRKIKRKAVLSVFNRKANESRIHILEDVSLEKFSTKSMANVLNTMEVSKSGKVGFITSGENQMLKRSVRNIPYIKHVNSKRITCKDIWYNQNLVISESALKELEVNYGASK